jgi:hypothetical protein
MRSQSGNASTKALRKIHNILKPQVLFKSYSAESRV